MFSGHRCYKIWLLCTCGKNHPKNISRVLLQAFSLKLHWKSKLPHKDSTMRKMPKYRLSLICIFQDMDTIVSVFSCIWIDSLILSKYKKTQIWFGPYTGKADQRKPVFRHNLRTVFLSWNSIIVWPENTFLLRTLRNFTKLLLLHSYR